MSQKIPSLLQGVKTKEYDSVTAAKTADTLLSMAGLMQHLSLPSGRINRLALVLGVMVQLMSKLLWKI